jgi:hypothetical protein
MPCNCKTAAPYSPASSAAIAVTGALSIQKLWFVKRSFMAILCMAYAAATDQQQKGRSESFGKKELPFIDLRVRRLSGPPGSGAYGRFQAHSGSI